MKQYSFLSEFLMTTLAGLGATMGTIGTIKSMRQNSVNNKQLKFMAQDLFNCKTREQALQVLEKYNNIGTTGQNPNGKVDKRLYALQSHIQTNYYIPLKKIIMNQNDPYWYSKMMQFINPQNARTKRKGTLRTGLNAFSAGLSAATLGAPQLMALDGVRKGLSYYFYYNQAKKQIGFLRISYYSAKLRKQLYQCQTPEQAIKTLEDFSYQFSNDAETKLKKVKNIPLGIQEKIRSQFTMPLINIIKNGGQYWKTQMTDYLKENNLQSTLQHICDSALVYFLPKIIQNGANAGADVASKTATKSAAAAIRR